MNLRKLTRLPTTEFSHDLLTGVLAIDDYLKRLDAELFGGASVRRSTLEEVRDHLLEQYASLIDQGLPADEAAQKTVDNFGSVKDIGAEQRQETGRDFFKNLLILALPFAIIMTIFDLISNIYGGGSLLAMSIKFVFWFLTGTLTAFFMTFSTTHLKPGKLPGLDDAGKSETIHVFLPKEWQWGSFVMLIIFLSALLLCLFGIFGIGLGTIYGFYGNLIMIYLSTTIVIGMTTAWTRITLQGNQLDIKTLFSHKHFAICEVTSFDRNPWPMFLLPRFGHTHRLTLVTDQGMTQTLYLTLGNWLYNSDLLIARLKNSTLTSG